MMHKRVTARLTALKIGLEENRHGGLLLTGDELEAFIREIGELRDLTRQLENERLRFVDVVDLRSLVDDTSAKVLDAMRAPDSNIRLFPVVGRPVSRSFHGGGDVA